MKNYISALMVLSLIILMFVLFALDSDNNDNDNKNVREVKAIVLETDNSNVIKSGVAKLGNQLLVIKILEGDFKGDQVAAVNQFLGQLELDSYYEPGDKLVAALAVEDGKIRAAKALEIYRQDWQLILFAVFVLCLIVFARITGLKALFSFVVSLYIIWNYLIPGLLEGKNPLLLTSVVLTLLSGVIIFAVAGFTKKGVAAFAGTMGGLFITIGITLFFGEKLHLNGLTSPFAGTLLFSGYQDLNLKYIFYSAIIIGASGAAMDIAMDVAAAMEEIKAKKPDIKMKELINSGFNVGKAVIGTMTTTLLLAYSGGYLTLLMLFMSKNSSLIRIVNLKIVAAEIMRTVIGSIGLVLVAPLTAIIAGWILSVEFKEVFKRETSKDYLEKRAKTLLK